VRPRVGTRCAVDLIKRLLGIDVSARLDADRTLPVVDPAVRAMLRELRMAGPEFAGLAEDEHLPTGPS
jgi:4-hydroxy-4-methyl-2-oxoglutarate aldolase